MRLRSLLFVPGDRPDRFAKALGTEADAIIIDLEDAVSASRKDYARDAVEEFLKGNKPAKPVFVRINALQTPELTADLAMVAASNPVGVVLPKAEGRDSVAELDTLLAESGSSALILPIAAETPAAVFKLGSYGLVSSRLCGLTWGIEDLGAALGVASSRSDDGQLTPPFETIRSMVLLGAHAAQVPAIESVFSAIADINGLTACAGRARRDGFSGMLAIHPTQVPVINEIFSPTAEEVSWAHCVVDAFDSNPRSGALRLDDQLIDAPHLARARRILLRPGT